MLRGLFSASFRNNAVALETDHVGASLRRRRQPRILIALDVESGKEVWRFKVNLEKGAPFLAMRGLAYYKQPEKNGPCAERILLNTQDARLIALDAHTGALCQGFGLSGQVSLLTGMGDVTPGYYYVTSAPTIVRGRVVLGGCVVDNQYWGEPSGVVRAFDAVTGNLAWAWDVGRPERHGEPPPGDSYTRSTPNSWAPMSADEKLGLVYVPYTSPAGRQFVVLAVGGSSIFQTKRGDYIIAYALQD